MILYLDKGVFLLYWLSIGTFLVGIFIVIEFIFVRFSCRVFIILVIRRGYVISFEWVGDGL